MNANPHRGEIVARIDGRDHLLCLTLGALAELEAAFGVGDLSALVARLGQGSLAARQLTVIIAAGLRGGGHPVTDAEVADMRFDGGLRGMAQTVARLVEATFGGGVAKARPVNPSLPQSL
jgi:hypothetical protein